MIVAAGGGGPSSDLAGIVDVGGMSAQSAMAEFRERTQVIPLLSRSARPHAYVELHIEQGPRLERSDQAIGVVTGIQGMRSLEIRIFGKSGLAAIPGRRRFRFAALADEAVSGT